MSKSYFKGYWMATNRCNLSCSYCVLENAPHQLKQELDLTSKKELVSHLFEKLNFRRLTLSGGEVLIIGRRPPKDFIELLRHIRTYKSDDPEKNLEIEVYTNGTFLTEEVANEMKGVVDRVAVTVDSYQNDFLTQIGRNNQRFNNYFQHIIEVCRLLTERGIELKLHSVIGQKNHHLLADEAETILNAIEEGGGKVDTWKFFQYMSYDMPQKDAVHAIPETLYVPFKERVENALGERNLNLHFKDNKEMNASLFNILSYGNAQYMRDNDSWSTSQRTHDLRTYQSMDELFMTHDINEERFRQFHEIAPCETPALL